MRKFLTGVLIAALLLSNAAIGFSEEEPINPSPEVIEVMTPTEPEVTEELTEPTEPEVTEEPTELVTPSEVPTEPEVIEVVEEPELEPEVTDELEPTPEIDPILIIGIQNENEQPFHLGDTVYLYAIVEGLDGIEWTITWQCSKNGPDGDYEPIQTGGMTCAIVLTEENADYWYRFSVTYETEE